MRRPFSPAHPLATLLVVAFIADGVYAQVAEPPMGGNAKPFELTWDAPNGCPSQADVAREVEELVSDASGARRSAPVKASARITQEPDRFVLLLTLREVQAERVRRIGAPTCDELGHAAALVVAIAVDPTILERRVDPIEPEPTPSGARSVPRRRQCRLSDLPVTVADCHAPAPTVVIAPPETKTKPVESVPLRWRLGFGTFVSHGILPGTQLGMSASTALYLDRLRLELIGTMLSNRAEVVGTGRGGDFGLYRGAPRACWLLGTHNWAIGPCASSEVGMISGQGYGDPTYRAKSALWAASCAGGAFEMRLGMSAFVTVATDVGIPWWRDEYRLNGLLLHQPSRVFANLGVSLAAGW